MRVSVDFDLCDSTGVCAATAPEVFLVDDEDRLEVLAERPAEALLPAVEEAARGCPKLAITLRED
jgi:ferredoxin